jgi:hypothetical protein
MHLLVRVVVATSVACILLGFCSAPARAQVVPPWLPGLSIKLLVRTIEFRDLVREEIRERLERRPQFYPRPVPPILLPLIEPPGDPTPIRATGGHMPLRPEFVP